MRRSLLFIPGNRPNMIQNGEVLPADALIFDLEDSVVAQDKDAARDLVAQALSSLDFGSRERLVRINGMDTGLAGADLDAMVGSGVDTILLPKVMGAGTVEEAASLLEHAERAHDRQVGSTSIVALLETALGIERAFEVAGASPRVTGLALGGEDLSADPGRSRTSEGWEISYSRSRLVLAAKAHGLDALDTPFTDVHDLEGCRLDTLFAKQLGFTGKLCISPFHLEVIHQAFMPGKEEIDYARALILAMKESEALGQGALSFRGRMIDPPVLRQAQRMLELAGLAGLPLDEEADHDQG